MRADFHGYVSIAAVGFAVVVADTDVVCLGDSVVVVHLASLLQQTERGHRCEQGVLHADTFCAS